MLMLDLGGHRNFIQRHHFNDDEIAAELGLQELVDADDFSPALAFDLTFLLVGYPDRLQANVQALGQLIGLDAVEQRILAFCVLLHTDPCLNDASDQLGALGFNRTLRVLSTLIDIPQEDLLPYLANEARLARAGLLGASLYEIACTDSDGDPVSAHQRLCALRSAMSALQSQKTVRRNRPAQHRLSIVGDHHGHRVFAKSVSPHLVPVCTASSLGEL